MYKIVEGLYISGYSVGNDNDLLRRNNITLRINASQVKDNDFIRTVDIDISDELGSNISKYFCRCNRIIYNERLKGGNVLVHCMAGHSRSVAIVLSYLTRKHKYKGERLSLEKAFELVSLKIPKVDLNPTFAAQLSK